MESTTERFNKAKRLSKIAERIGFAIWQIQELEGACATFLILASEATPGIGVEAGLALEKAAKAKTFGRLLAGLKKKGTLEPDLEQRLDNILSERNWLVHRSRASSRSAVYHDTDAKKTIQRIDDIAQEALALLREIGKKVSEIAESCNISEIQLNQSAQQILAGWRKSDPSS